MTVDPQRVGVDLVDGLPEFEGSINGSDLTATEDIDAEEGIDSVRGVHENSHRCDDSDTDKKNNRVFGHAARS